MTPELVGLSVGMFLAGLLVGFLARCRPGHQHEWTTWDTPSNSSNPSQHRICPACGLIQRRRIDAVDPGTEFDRIWEEMRKDGIVR